MGKAKEVNEKHHITEKSKDAARKMATNTRNFNEKHQVTQKSMAAASATSKKMMEGMKFVSWKMKKSRAGSSEPGYSVISIAWGAELVDSTAAHVFDVKLFLWMCKLALHK